MNKNAILVICLVLFLAGVVTAVVAVSFHRIRVVEGISGTPVAGAFISVERSTGSTEEMGQTDEKGELVFWVSPLPLPRRICVQKTFYPPGCTDAIGLTRKVIELVVP